CPCRSFRTAGRPWSQTEFWWACCFRFPATGCSAMVDRVIRVLLAGGGTGGHVYPAIAIARAIEKGYPNSMIRFAGTKTHMEWKAVPAAGYQITPIAARGLQRGQLLRNLGIPFVVAKGLFQSW